MSSIRFLLITLILGLGALTAGAATDPAEKTDDSRDRLLRERTYLSEPLSYWLKILEDRDVKTITQAFDAIRSLGHDGWIAVPNLERLIALPFVPIEIGKDSHETIATKLCDIAVRVQAVDIVAGMGESGSAAAMVLVRWALMERVIPVRTGNSESEELYMELVILNAEQRMRVAGAIAQFGSGASPVIAGLLTSLDDAKRKLGVSILGQGALPIAAELLRSQDCDGRTLGLQIIQDMDLVFEKSHIEELEKRLACGRFAKGAR